MDNPNIAGWSAMAQKYQSESDISTHEIHISPFGPGALSLGLITPKEGEKYLELGCGAAQNSIALDRRGVNTYAVDGSEIQLKNAISLISSSGARTKLIKSDLEKLDWLKPNAFDGVVSCFAAEFVTDFEKFIDSIYYTLKDGGVMLLATVHPLGAFEWDELEGYLRVNDYLNPPVEVWNEQINSDESALTIFRTLEDMYSVLISYGFTVESILEPTPLEDPLQSPYKGRYWEPYLQRFKKIPFSLVFTARK